MQPPHLKCLTEVGMERVRGWPGRSLEGLLGGHNSWLGQHGRIYCLYSLNIKYKLYPLSFEFPAEKRRKEGLKLQIDVSAMNNYASEQWETIRWRGSEKACKIGVIGWQIKFARGDINNAKMCKISGKATHNWGDADRAAVINHDPSSAAWEWYDKGKTEHKTVHTDMLLL